MQIYLQYFNKNSSTAVPLRNAQSPQEQIVRSEAKIRKVQSFSDLCKKSVNSFHFRGISYAKFGRMRDFL